MRRKKAANQALSTEDLHVKEREKYLAEMEPTRHGDVTSIVYYKISNNIGESRDNCRESTPDLVANQLCRGSTNSESIRER